MIACWSMGLGMHACTVHIKKEIVKPPPQNHRAKDWTTESPEEGPKEPKAGTYIHAVKDFVSKLVSMIAFERRRTTSLDVTASFHPFFFVASNSPSFFFYRAQHYHMYILDKSTKKNPVFSNTTETYTITTTTTTKRNVYTGVGIDRQIPGLYWCVSCGIRKLSTPIDSPR